MAKIDEGVSIDDLESLDEVITPKPEKRSSTKSKSKRSTSSRKPPLEKRLTTMIKLIGEVTSGLDKYDGQVIVEAAPRLAEALVELANENERAKRFLESALEGGAWAGVGAVVGWEIVTPIAVHHRMLPEPINGNLAEIRGIPVKEPKRRAESPLTVVREAPEPARGKTSGDDAPVRLVEARDPETGVWGTFPAGPDGRPIFPSPEERDRDHDDAS